MSISLLFTRLAPIALTLTVSLAAYGFAHANDSDLSSRNISSRQSVSKNAPAERQASLPDTVSDQKADENTDMHTRFELPKNHSREK